jgi:hypothetical protein
MQKRATPVISDKVKAIHDKLQVSPKGDTLTRSEKALEITREEAAYLLSLRAGRNITTDYLRQLMRGDKPRLKPYRATGNTYTYTVEALLEVKFTKQHKNKSEANTSTQKDTDQIPKAA